MAYALEKMPEMVVKEINENFSNVDYEDRIIKGWCSKFTLDRDGEIVVPTAFEKRLDIYRENPILLTFHRHKELPVGKCISIEVKPDGLWGEFYISKTKYGDEVLTLIKEGCLKGFSAGFVPISFDTNPEKRSVPSKALKNLGKKGFIKRYDEVELVEISLLSIPSNRESLIQYSEKGNSVAGLIVKSFDLDSHEDLSHVITEYMIDNGRCNVLKGLLEGSQEHGVVLKGLLDGSSYHHAITKPLITFNHLTQNRDPFGKYVQREEVSTPPNSTENKLDTLIQQQRQMVESLQSIDNKDSWTAWAKKWGTRLAIAAAGYGLWKAGGKELLANAAKQHLSSWIKGKKRTLLDMLKEGADYIRRGYENDEEAKALILTDSMDILDTFLQKGRKLGLQKTPEYKELENKYREVGSKIVNLVKESNESGFKGFLNNIDNG